MALEKNINPIKLAKWVKIILILDIVINFLLLLIFPGLWLNIAVIFVIVATGTIVSYLIYEQLVKNNDNNWIKPAEILGIISIGINAAFCIIIGAAMILGVLAASGTVRFS